MIQLKNISVTIDNHHILKNINASIQSGDFVVLLGANGAGKSTLFNVLAGKEEISEGTITINGTLTNSSAQRIASTAQLHQDPLVGSVGSLTVRENLALALYRAKRARLTNAVSIVTHSALEKEVLRLFGTSAILDKPMKRLSGGQRQLLAFLMVTAYPTSLLLLDEPTAALDPQSADKMIQLIQHVAATKKSAILLITHDISLAQTLEASVWIMRQGIIVHQLNLQEKKELSDQDIKRLMYE